MTGDVLVRHGWTYRELRNLAQIAARRVSVAQWNYDERVDVALVAVVVRLLEAEERPDQETLIYAGFAAVREMWSAECNTQGWTKVHTPAPRYHWYWAEWHRPAQPATDRIVERIALEQVHAALTDDERWALWTRAYVPRIGDAAKVQGITRHQFSRNYWSARDRANQLWFGDETPARAPRRSEGTSSATGKARQQMVRQRIARGAGRR